MSLFQWADKYSVGHANIDAQHQRLFQLADELFTAMTKGKGKDVLSRTLEALVSYTKAHFAMEERLMELHKYPELARHKTEHDLLTKQVLQFQTDFAAGRVTVTLKLMEFLQNWLTQHIGMTDRKIAAFLNKQAA